MTQKVVHKMGGVNNIYDFFTKKFFLSKCHFMKKTISISIKNYFFYFSSVQVIQCPKFEASEPNFGQYLYLASHLSV
jgi:hypothetical protein